MSHQRNSLKRKLSDSNSSSSGQAAAPVAAAASAQTRPKAQTAAVAFRGGGWQSGLKVAVSDASQTLLSDADCVIIADKYPKAAHHYLVMPKRQIESLARLTSSDAPLLRHMLTAARQFISGMNLKESAFRFGFHAVPSMSQLHMHVISQDFVSPCLKNKKHWLSFTSEFFLDCAPLLRVLESDGGPERPLGPRVTLLGGQGLAIDTAWFSALIKQGELKCNQCARVCKNMPDLKAHLCQHLPAASD